MAGFSRFRELMAVEPDITDAPGASRLACVRGEVEFRDVAFSYDEGVSVLTGINLHIRAGETLALVGPSGGGKSTLCHLIPRFYEIDAGEIRIDGRNIRDITLASPAGAGRDRAAGGAALCGHHSREYPIRPHRRDGDEVVEAAKKAEIHEDILAMPDGYQTYVGERGIMLSGGQKQRVSIARIFLKNPSILILDEATSALDTVTEAHIQAAFDKLSQGRTTLGDRPPPLHYPGRG